MGFYITDINQIRFRISYKAYETVLQDIDEFQNLPEKEQVSSFLNRVIKNFYSEAESTIEENKDKIYKKYLMWLSGLSDREKTASVLTDREIGSAREEISRKYGQPQKGKGQNLKLILTKRVREILMFSKESKVYEDKISDYIAALVQEYAMLPHEERERIYFYDTYLQIYNCIRNNHEAEVIINENAYIFKPFIISANGMLPYLYAAGYSIRKDKENSEERLVSFRLSRIQSAEERFSHSISFSKDQKAELKKISGNNSLITYLAGEDINIVVRLTEKGYRMFSSIIISGRPSLVSKDIVSDNDIRICICCSEEQAYNYFLKFGAEAEIIDPPDLRNRFREMSSKLANIYLK